MVSQSYEVAYVDRSQRLSIIAARLEREEAITLACREAKKRATGRMFAEGSSALREVVVIREERRSQGFSERPTRSLAVP